MEGMEVQEAAGQMEPGSCEGNWDANDPLCSRRSCLNSEKCERITKSAKSKKENESQKAVEPEEKPVEVNPIEALLGVLESQFGCKMDETDKAKMYKFNKDGEPVIDVFVSKTGKVRLVSPKGVKTLNSIESIEQVDVILRELL